MRNSDITTHWGDVKMLTFWSLHENLTGDIQVDFQLKRAKNENGSNNKIIKKVSFEKLILNSIVLFPSVNGKVLAAQPSGYEVQPSQS